MSDVSFQAYFPRSLENPNVIQMIFRKKASFFSRFVEVMMTPTLIAAPFAGFALGWTYGLTYGYPQSLAGVVGAVSAIGVAAIVMKTIQLAGDALVDGTLFVLKLPFTIIKEAGLLLEEYASLLIDL